MTPKSPSKSMSYVNASTDIMKAFKGSSKEFTPQDAFVKLFDKFIYNLSSWVHTLKSYIIFHMSLQDALLTKFISAELLRKEDTLYSFAKKIDDTCYESLKHFEISTLYTKYIRIFLLISKEGTFVYLQEKELPEYFKSLNGSELLWVYDKIEDLIITIIKIFAEAHFCAKYRIYKCIYQLLFQDIERFNKSLIIALNELTLRIKTFEIENAIKVCHCFANYIEITKDIKAKIELITHVVKLQVMHIKYFEGDESQLKILKEYVDQKAALPIIMQKMSSTDSELPKPEIPKLNIVAAKQEGEPEIEDEHSHNEIVGYNFLFGSDVLCQAKKSSDNIE